jgi:hypothetical protein
MPAATDQMASGPGDDSLPHAEASSLPAPGVLRADHVQLTGAVPGLPFLTNGIKRPGWLVLTDRGEFRFYDKGLPAMTKAPALSAASVDQFVRKVSAIGVRVRFGKGRYNMWFTGEPAPERRSAGIEEKTGQGGEIVSGAGSAIASAGASLGQSISVFGNLVSLVVDVLQLYRMARNRKRRAAAKAAWYPVLRGARPWYMINGAKEAPVEAPESEPMPA